MFLGIDIGGTNIKFGIVDENYHIHKKYSIVTEKDKGDKHLVEKITEKAKKIKDEFNYDRIGIGTPGMIDSENGVVVWASNLPYNNTPIVEMLEKAVGVPVKLANDATCAVCGELYAGIGQKYEDFLMVTLGTGVGGGIVINRKPYFGKLGGAGEFGHIIINYGGISCGCGEKGCYEQYASVTALIKQTEEAIKNNPGSLLAQMSEGGVTGRTAFDAKRLGCSVANDVVEQYIDYISVGLKSLARAFQPEAIVLGGAISNEGDYIIKPLKEKINLSVELFASELKNDAGILGAVAIAKENII